MENLMKQDKFLKKVWQIAHLIKIFGFSTVEFKDFKMLKMLSYKVLETFQVVKNYGFMRLNYKIMINKWKVKFLEKVFKTTHQVLDSGNSWFKYKNFKKLKNYFIKLLSLFPKRLIYGLHYQRYKTMIMQKRF